MLLYSQVFYLIFCGLLPRVTIDFIMQNLQVFPFGSVPLKTYLPDGDIDLTALSFPNSEDALANDVRSVLQSEEQNKGAEFEVKDVQYINAEVFHSSGILFIGCYEVLVPNHLHKFSIRLYHEWSLLLSCFSNNNFAVIQ